MTEVVKSDLFERASRRIGGNESFRSDDFPDLKGYLQCHWSLAAGETDAANQWFDRLFESYTEAQRYYHTVVHLWEVLEYVEAVEKSQILSSQELPPNVGTILRLATFFHDAIYDPKSSGNEVKSADLFHQFSKEFCMEDSMRIHVRVLILATEKHSVLENTTVNPILQQHFLDMDMAVLGKEAGAYMLYAAAIRSEYAHVPRDFYCSKRAEILRGFCQGRIYFSEAFQNVLGNRARENLQAEIQLLESNIIPGDV